MMMPFVWLAVIVAAAVIEMATAQLVSVWFAIGGVGALIACVLGAPLLWQLVVFAAVSAVMLAVTRPVVKQKLTVKKTSTNADRYIGKIAVVTVGINNTLETGQVNVLGSIWTAWSADGSEIPAGSRVVVESIRGVKLIVHPKSD
ncbi:MAG: NfeD family protein [Oscillospiraceae bacterium]|jgi:membrane protein implicated in regulation of membrane protease activity|nr:NfeD family protein [Oscillospiraceae bacterium]